MASEHLLEGAGDVISYEEWEMGIHTHYFLDVFLGVCVCHGMHGRSGDNWQELELSF